MRPRIAIGWDAREDDACRIAEASYYRRSSHALDIRFLDAARLRAQGLYSRPTRQDGLRTWDIVSGAYMSTAHANARFLLPWVYDGGWVLFTDGDILVRDDVRQVFALADERYAVMCVQHGAMETGLEKKGGHAQQAYPRKNWSSVMLWNLDHPAHRRLSLADVNGRPGRELHAFYWLEDAEIGALPARWNHLVGVDPVPPAGPDGVALAHFTLGLPRIPGYEACAFADEWRTAGQLLAVGAP